MKVFQTISSLQEEINQLKVGGKTIGFVPTMGALHAGHLSLLACSQKRNDVTVLSIFVNPTQFDRQEDLDKYPRMFSEDLALLQEKSCDIVFQPSVQEMYPEKDERQFDFGMLDKVMEGKHRAGHFNGVAQVVSKLFAAVQPTAAYFGQKDFQQLAIIRRMTAMLSFPIEIVACPIVRESDGLAMSSRNLRLTAEQREQAVLISETLRKALKISTSMTISELENWVTERVNVAPALEVEYFEIVDKNSLQRAADWGKLSEKVACIAVFVGELRLIDNISF